MSPIFFLPTFAREKIPGLSPLVRPVYELKKETSHAASLQLAALPITMLNFAAAFGRTVVGYAADQIGPVNALWSVIMLSGLTQLLVWTFVSNYAGIVRTRVLSSLPLCPSSRGPTHMFPPALPLLRLCT